MLKQGSILLAILSFSHLDLYSHFWPFMVRERRPTYFSLEAVLNKCQAEVGRSWEESCGRSLDKFKGQLNQNSISKNCDTPLCLVVAQGSKEKAMALIKRGADINFANQNGSLPIEVAVRSNQPAMVDLLVANGAKLNDIVTSGQHTLLGLAILLGHTEVIEKLNNHGAKLSANDLEFFEQQF